MNQASVPPVVAVRASRLLKKQPAWGFGGGSGAARRKAPETKSHKASKNGHSGDRRERPFLLAEAGGLENGVFQQPASAR